MLTQMIVTILNGASLSDALKLNGDFWPMVVIPDSAWDTNTMSFQGSFDGTNFFDIYDVDSGLEYTIAAVAAQKGISLKWQNFTGWKHLKVRSGTSAAAVNQNGNTVLTVNVEYAG